MAHELEQTKRERQRAEQQVKELQSRLQSSEQKEYEAMLQVRDSVQMVETAMMEKDQVDCVSSYLFFLFCFFYHFIDYFIISFCHFIYLLILSSYLCYFIYGFCYFANVILSFYLFYFIMQVNCFCHVSQ